MEEWQISVIGRQQSRNLTNSSLLQLLKADKRLCDQKARRSSLSNLEKEDILKYSAMRSSLIYNKGREPHCIKASTSKIRTNSSGVAGVKEELYDLKVIGWA